MADFIVDEEDEHGAPPKYVLCVSSILRYSIVLPRN